MRGGGLDGDGVILLDHVGLLGRSQIARRIRLLPQALNRFHHLRLLRDENVAEPRSPLELLVHHREHLRERGERFDARVPILLLDGFDRLLSRQARIAPGPARRLHHLERISGGHEDLRQQRVGIKRDRGEHLIELLLRSRGLARRGRGLRKGDRRRDEQHEQRLQRMSYERFHGHLQSQSKVGISLRLMSTGTYRLRLRLNPIKRAR